MGRGGSYSRLLGAKTGSSLIGRAQPHDTSASHSISLCRAGMLRFSLSSLFAVLLAAAFASAEGTPGYGESRFIRATLGSVRVTAHRIMRRIAASFVSSFCSERRSRGGFHLPYTTSCLPAAALD